MIEACRVRERGDAKDEAQSLAFPEQNTRDEKDVQQTLRDEDR
jgi:hypothetical protein